MNGIGTGTAPGRRLHTSSEVFLFQAYCLTNIGYHLVYMVIHH